MVLAGGSVGGSQSAYSPPSHVHTPAFSQSSPLSKFAQKSYDLGSYSVPEQHPSSSYCGDGVGDGVGSFVGGVHSSDDGSFVSIHVHSIATSHRYPSSIELQYDHVTGELPAQHPGMGPGVGAGGRVSDGGSVTDGGAVGGEQTDGSSVTIHEHTPLYSQTEALSKSLQNSAVRKEYPVQHPDSSVGDGVGFEVGG